MCFSLCHILSRVIYEPDFNRKLRAVNIAALAVLSYINRIIHRYNFVILAISTNVQQTEVMRQRNVCIIITIIIKQRRLYVLMPCYINNVKSRFMCTCLPAYTGDVFFCTCHLKDDDDDDDDET